jgi:hypothetical protein
MVDVINKTCVELDCSTRPCYGFPSSDPSKRGNPERCSLHKLPGMVNVVGKPVFIPKKLMCSFEGEDNMMYSISFFAHPLPFQVARVFPALVLLASEARRELPCDALLIALRG